MHRTTVLQRNGECKLFGTYCTLLWMFSLVVGSHAYKGGGGCLEGPAAWGIGGSPQYRWENLVPAKYLSSNHRGEEVCPRAYAATASARDSRPGGQARMRTHSPRAHAYKRPTSPPYPDAIGRSLSPAAQVRITERVKCSSMQLDEVNTDRVPAGRYPCRRGRVGLVARTAYRSATGQAHVHACA